MMKEGNKKHKKVLIVTYYWPPAGGGGLPRWLKMSKYLFNNSDWTPVIYTPKNAGYLVTDESTLNEVPHEMEVLKLPIIEPNNFLDILGLASFKKNVASGGVGKKSGKMSPLSRLMLWIRSNIFIPDPRFLWINPSVRFLNKQIKAKSIDAIITTGPPHSLHLIGLKLKKKTGIPWIADYRDPWTFIDYFDDLDLNKSALKKHINLETKVLQNADQLITVSPSWAEEFKQRFNANFELIYNGFDPEDFTGKAPALDKKFTITHIGSLNKDRNAKILWEAIAELSENNADLKKEIEVHLIGTITPELKATIKALNIQDIVIVKNYMPHKEVIKRIRKSQLLLLLVNNSSNVNGIIPGKLYEYLGANRPVLCIGNPDADSAKIINECHAGDVIDFSDKHLMKKSLLKKYKEFKDQGFVSSKTENIDRFSRKAEAMQYAAILDKITKHKNS